MLLFAGRVDASKGAPLMAETVKRLTDEGLNVHALVVGEGQDRARIASLLSGRATTPGNLPQAELAWIYASGDVFVFPSTTEVTPTERSVISDLALLSLDGRVRDNGAALGFNVLPV